MDALVRELLTSILLYKYAAIFAFTFLGALALPIPSSAVLMSSGFFATQGYLNFPLVVATGLLGEIAGDNSGYWLARIYGERFFSRIGLGRAIRARSVRTFERRIARHPIATVFFSRFFGSATPAVNVATGMARMPYRKFFLWAAAGQCCLVVMQAVLGYVFGSNWQYLHQLFLKFFPVIVVAVALLVVVFWRRIIRNDAEEEARRPDAGDAGRGSGSVGGRSVV